MGKFLNKDASDISVNWKEWQIQAYIVQESHRAELIFAAGMEGNNLNKSSRAKATATGRTAGEPDLRYYFKGGRMIMIELKTGKGSLTKSQESRIPLLQKLGFEIHIVIALTPEDGWTQIKKILGGLI